MSYRIASQKLSKSKVVAQTNQTARLALRADDFIFAQTSIVSSVMTELNSHLIKPETARFINSNGDGWTNETLSASYKTFIGAYNYVNHVQDPDKAVGFIADAALRRIILNPETKTYVFYVDILVCTHRDFSDLVQKILTEQIQYLSMGCDMQFSTCSACGHVAYDEIDMCDHLLVQKGKYFIDKYGVKRITAELLGNSQPGTVTFIEASWLSQVPAFGGAIRRSLLPVPTGAVVELSLPVEVIQKDAVMRFVN